MILFALNSFEINVSNMDPQPRETQISSNYMAE